MLLYCTLDKWSFDFGKKTIVINLFSDLTVFRVTKQQNGNFNVITSQHTELKRIFTKIVDIAISSMHFISRFLIQYLSVNKIICCGMMATGDDYKIVFINCIVKIGSNYRETSIFHKENCSKDTQL